MHPSRASVALIAHSSTGDIASTNGTVLGIIQIFRLNLLPAVRIEPSTARSKLKSNALTDCPMGAIY